MYIYIGSNFCSKIRRNAIGIIRDDRVELVCIVGVLCRMPLSGCKETQLTPVKHYPNLSCMKHIMLELAASR